MTVVQTPNAPNVYLEDRYGFIQLPTPHPWSPPAQCNLGYTTASGGQYAQTHSQRDLPPYPHPRRSNAQSSPPPPMRYDQHRTSGPQRAQAPSLASPSTSPSGDGYDDEPQGSVYAQAKAKYDNPLAHNPAWSPTSEDAGLRDLPTIDFMLRVKSRLARKAGNPFDPEPRSFQRPVPLSAAGASQRGFRPVVHKSSGKNKLIGDGFKPAYYGPLFAAHDISAADYARFLEDIFTAGKVSGAGQLVAAVAPISMHMGATGYFVTKAITRAMARRNEPIVVDTVETWQERFFGPRGLDVYVVQDDRRVTARHVGEAPQALSSDVARMVSASASHKDKDARKERRKEKKDKGGSKPYLVIAPLPAGSHYVQYDGASSPY